MDRKEIIDRINSVRVALDNMTVTGAENAGKVSGCFIILTEIANELIKEAEKAEEPTVGISESSTE